MKKSKKNFFQLLSHLLQKFIALYGRRRVGKTYLVKKTFSEKKGTLFFPATGIMDGLITEQLEAFINSVGDVFLYPGARLETPTNWQEAFKTLNDNINASKAKKIVLFFDEFPWMVTPNSRLLKMLEYFWNHYWSNNPRIKLIICGSSASWILKHIINNQDGLYNRVTHTIHLEPFTLRQVKEFLRHRKVALSNKQIIQLYMVLGGIPHYLAKVKPRLTTPQIIEELAFKKDSFLNARI